MKRRHGWLVQATFELRGLSLTLRSSCRGLGALLDGVVAIFHRKIAWWSVLNKAVTGEALAVSAKPLLLNSLAERMARFLAKGLWWDVLDSNQ